MAKSKTQLSQAGLERLRVQLRQTTGFSLSVEMHGDIDRVLENFEMNNIEDLFRKHGDILGALQVSTLEELKKIQ